jgi:hypothetical protein
MKAIKYLPIKTIAAQLNITPEQARQVKGVITGKICTGKFESVNSWVRQCHNEPKLYEKRLCALNEIIGGYGIEAVFPEYDGMVPLFEYINMGESYKSTIVRYSGGRYIISTMGDEIDHCESRGGFRIS